MPDERPRKPRLGNFASFDADALGQGTRRRVRYVINPTRTDAHAMPQAGRLASLLEAEIAQGLGMRPAKELSRLVPSAKHA
jgi:hypothetical protein